MHVLIEMRVARSSGNSPSRGSLGSLPSLVVDSQWFPVISQPGTQNLQVSLDSSREQLILIRGRIDEKHLPALYHQSNVVGIYTDSEVAPFNCHNNCFVGDDWIVEVEPCSPIHCPIPPCDCAPMRARGSLSDVAKYLGADQIWRDGVDGENIVIGIVDGGLWAEDRMDINVPGLVPSVIDGWPKSSWGTIAGWRGHGNMVAIDALGIAPKARLFDIRISDSHFNGAHVSDAIAGIHWAIESYRLRGAPQILCCCWGLNRQADDPRYAADINHPLTRKVVEAIDEGILVLFAAGNGGHSCPATSCKRDIGPAKSIWGANGHLRVMTVGAVNKDEELIGYSSQGPAALDEFKPDFCGISHFAGYFSSDSGTSTACAISTGIVALLLQARPGLTQEVAKRLLRATAKDIGPPGWDRHSGAGIIQAKAAYDLIKAHRPPSRIQLSRLERLETENRQLRELFVELSLERQSNSNRSTPD